MTTDRFAIRTRMRDPGLVAAPSADPATAWVNHPAGLMFGFRRKKLSGSYFFFSAANRP
jgi:hypothetical protein